MSSKTPKGFRPLSDPPEPMVEILPPESGSDLGEPPPVEHLDAIAVEEPEGTAADMGEGSAAAPVVISRDDFHALFCGVFGMASAVTRLQSLAVNRDDPRARPCTEAIYDIAEEVPALRFLIEPGGVWMQRAVAIGAFAVPMGMGVAAELRARQAAGDKRRQTPKGNPPPPPVDGSEIVGVPVD